MDVQNANSRLDGIDRLRDLENNFAESTYSEQASSHTSRDSEPSRDPAVFEAADIVPSSIPMRDFRLGQTFARSNVSSVIASGGSGKTALRIAQALAMASAQVSGAGLTGEYVQERSKVLFVCFEDGEQELQRRMAAAMKHYHIDPEILRGWLLLWAPSTKDGKLMQYNPQNGNCQEGALAATLRKLIQEENIDVVILDPLIKLHSLNENDNSQMDELIQLLTDMAVEYNIAIDIPHHTSKGTGSPGDADKGRGASAVVSGARLVYTLNRMSVDEGKEFGISEDRRRHFVRMDSAKVNIAPPSRKADWFELRGITIDNGSKTSEGDNVQVMVPWEPPSLMHGLDSDIQDRILLDIKDGLGDGNRYSRKPGARARCVSIAFQLHAPEVEPARARKIVGEWIKDGIVSEKPYPHPKRREEVQGLFVHNAWKPNSKQPDG